MRTTGRIWRTLALAFILPLLGGCFVTSENPVLRAGEDGRDAALRGLWVTQEGREFLHVLRPEPDDNQNGAHEAPGFSALYVISRGDGAGDRDGWTRVRMISTEVNNRKILSMRFTGGESGGDLGGIPGWLIFTYDIREERLYLRMIREDPVNDAIKAGGLAGTPKSETASDPHVTASAEEWVAFLEKADLETLFRDDEDSFLVRLSVDRIRRMTGEDGARAGENSGQ